MAEIKWIKITTDIFDDEKILLIESLPDADSIIVVWFKLLCLAGKQNNSGVFVMNGRIAYTDKMLATIFRRKESTVKLALETFERFGMVELIDGVITIPNWGKHQNLDQLENRKEYMRTYMREYREKQAMIADKSVNSLHKTNGKTNRKANVNEADKEIDKDKEIEVEGEKNNNNDHLTMTKKALEDEFELAWGRYPKKQGKQNALKAFIKARKDGVPLDKILNGIDSYCEYVKGTDMQYIKQGSTWFNQKCWEDVYEKRPTGDGGKTARAARDLRDGFDMIDAVVSKYGGDDGYF